MSTFERMLEVLREIFEGEDLTDTKGEFTLTAFYPEEGSPREVQGAEELNNIIWNESGGEIRKLRITYYYGVMDVEEMRNILISNLFSGILKEHDCENCSMRDVCDLPNAIQWRQWREEAA
ncbi:hypothetical protein KBG31_01130 [Patescibacteria group bacterium]|nr:hypothetical protein [Patescibacteria group bacterium]